MKSRMVRGLVVLLVAALVVPGFVMDTAKPGNVSAQGLRDGLPTGPVFIEAEGVTSAVLAQGQAETPAAGSQMLLEELEVPANGSLPEAIAASTEILLVREGAVSITDSFGFSATTPTGQALIFAPGSSYQLTNTGATPATILRLTTTPGDGIPEGSEASPAAVERTVLIAHPIEAHDGPVTLFLADAVFEPGSTSGVLEHDGPLGIVIETGTLDVLSPSGITGQLQQGAAVVLPATAPLVASNTGLTDASVLFAGIVATGESLVTEITPTPAPTAIPTATPTPSPTPEPTLPPTPTPVPTTEYGMTLALGETWIADEGSLTVSAGIDEWGGDLLIDLTYTNRTEERQDFDTAAVSACDDRGACWEPLQSSNDIPDRVIVEAGQSVSYTRMVESPEGDDYVANVLIGVQRFGGVSLAQWGLTYNRGQLLDSPATGIDTVEGEPTLPLNMFLPSGSELPVPVAGPDWYERSIEMIARIRVSDPAGELARLQEFGWLGNTFGYYQVDNCCEDVELGTVYGYGISITEYATGSGAASGFDSTLQSMVLDGYVEATQYDQAGTTVHELTFPTDDDNSTHVVAAQLGNYVVIVYAYGWGADPASAALGTFDLVVARIEAETG